MFTNKTNIIKLSTKKAVKKHENVTELISLQYEHSSFKCSDIPGSLHLITDVYSSEHVYLKRNESNKFMHKSLN